MVDEPTVPGDPSLVVRDYGGEGEQSIVLLHGLGGNVLHWADFAPLLTPHFRVVAYDLRCHGKSGDGPLNWDVLLDDLERVVAHLGLDRPAVLGHSFGGEVAALWAERHPECPGAVDLDGIRTIETDLENYVGLDVETARRQRDELTEVFEAQARAMAAPLADEQYEAMRRQNRQLGGASKVEMLDRNIRLVDGDRYLRPDAATARTYRDRMQGRDFIGVFAEVHCPLLVCAATDNMPGGDGFEDLQQAYRRGIERDLTAVQRTNPNLRVEYVEASHGMVHEQPGRLAKLVEDFLPPA